MADVFISYKREERAAVERIAHGLRELGLSVWFDARLGAGSSFDEEINREVRSAGAVLVCWTPSAVESKWVRAEALIGSERGVLAPVFLEPTDLFPPFNLAHTLNLTGWRGAHEDPAWLDVLDRIGALIGRPGLRHVALALASGGTLRVAGVETEATSRGQSGPVRRRAVRAARVKEPANEDGALQRASMFILLAPIFLLVKLERALAPFNPFTRLLYFVLCCAFYGAAIFYYPFFGAPAPLALNLLVFAFWPRHTTSDWRTYFEGRATPPAWVVAIGGFKTLAALAPLFDKPSWALALPKWILAILLFVLAYTVGIALGAVIFTVTVLMLALRPRLTASAWRQFFDAP